MIIPILFSFRTSSREDPWQGYYRTASLPEMETRLKKVNETIRKRKMSLEGDVTKYKKKRANYIYAIFIVVALYTGIFYTVIYTTLFTLSEGAKHFAFLIGIFAMAIPGILLIMRSTIVSHPNEFLYYRSEEKRIVENLIRRRKEELEIGTKKS